MPIGPDSNPSQGFRPSNQQLTGYWNTQDEAYWRDQWQSRPYVQADRGFEFYRDCYRFGQECANRHQGREWSDVEEELHADWDRSGHQGASGWDQAKDAVRDAWDRVRHGR